MPQYTPGHCNFSYFVKPFQGEIDVHKIALLPKQPVPPLQNSKSFNSCDRAINLKVVKSNFWIESSFQNKKRSTPLASDCEQVSRKTRRLDHSTNGIINVYIKKSKPKVWPADLLAPCPAGNCSDPKDSFCNISKRELFFRQKITIFIMQCNLQHLPNKIWLLVQNIFSLGSLFLIWWASFIEDLSLAISQDIFFPSSMRTTSPSWSRWFWYLCWMDLRLPRNLINCDMGHRHWKTWTSKPHTPSVHNL